jgi:hypothetical protein
VVRFLKRCRAVAGVAVSRVGVFRGEVMPRISSSVARGGGAAGAVLLDGADEVGASVADGMWFSSSSVNPDCACVTTRLGFGRLAGA